MANLDIAERRLPQDGRIRLRVQGKEIDLRVSTVPTMHGESVVMRILDKGGVALDFKRARLRGRHARRRSSTCCCEPHGILLVTGPTGSGKTTTLYTALDRLNKPDVKILTVEDPVEYQMPGINQIQVKPQIDLTFANALRSIVRQDPDVIMIGEIRDLETAQIAVQSALTGHLVLSTVHTNDAAEHGQPAARHGRRGLPAHLDGDRHPRAAPGAHALSACARSRTRRCRRSSSELGLRKFAQRRRHHALSRQRLHAVRADRLHRADQHHGNAADDRSVAQPRHAARDRRPSCAPRRSSEGMVTMYEDGMRKALNGVTTFEEVLRVTREN